MRFVVSALVFLRKKHNDSSCHFFGVLCDRLLLFLLVHQLGTGRPAYNHLMPSGFSIFVLSSCSFFFYVVFCFVRLPCYVLVLMLAFFRAYAPWTPGVRPMNVLLAFFFLRTVAQDGIPQPVVYFPLRKSTATHVYLLCCRPSLVLN